MAVVNCHRKCSLWILLQWPTPLVYRPRETRVITTTIAWCSGSTSKPVVEPSNENARSTSNRYSLAYYCPAWVRTSGSVLETEREGQHRNDGFGVDFAPDLKRQNFWLNENPYIQSVKAQRKWHQSARNYMYNKPQLHRQNRFVQNTSPFFFSFPEILIPSFPWQPPRLMCLKIS